MKVVIACGGTGGHAFPGVAVAEEMARRGHDVSLWGSGRDVETFVVRGWKGRLFATGARQLKAANLPAMAMSFLRCRREMRREKPDALLAMGSYSSLPPVFAARSAGVPIVLHEANTVPGRAVEFLSRFATAVATSFDTTSGYLPGVRTVRTGLPVREGIASGRRFPSIPEGAFTVFVTGGSQGAHAVNELMCDAMALMRQCIAERGPGARPLYVIHQTGMKDEAPVMAAYARIDQPARVCAFESDMPGAFASADIVVARAGASTCFELAACGKPALLIPLPTSLRDHQHHNAEAFVAAGAADEGVQARLSPQSVCRYLMGRYDNQEKLLEMGRRMASLATPGAAAAVADLMEGVKRPAVQVQAI